MSKMKKYRLKEEVNKYFRHFSNTVEPLEWWLHHGTFTKEALEEVPQRIELKINPSEFEISSNSIIKIGGNFTDQEKELCEKALNGELFSVEELDRIYENEYYEEQSVTNFIKWLRERK